jgi:hypothetical protein
MLSYSASRTDGNVTVTDLFWSAFNGKDTPMGAMSAGDKIYLANSTGVCGMVHGYGYDFANPQITTSALGTVEQALAAPSGTSVLITRSAKLTLPTAAGWYKLCYYRSQKTATISTSGGTPVPYVRDGWYHIMNNGPLETGGGTPFFVTALLGTSLGSDFVKLNQRSTAVIVARFSGSLSSPHSQDYRKATPRTTLGTLVPGQEARFRLDIHAATYYGFNATGTGNTRLRIIAAYPGRAASGTAQRCQSYADADVWAEFGALQIVSYGWARRIAYKALVTFTVPPFPWRACVHWVVVVSDGSKLTLTNSSYEKGTTDSTWRELHNMQGIVMAVNTTARYVWSSAPAMHTGDYAAIRIFQNGYSHPMRLAYNFASHIDGDLVKILAWYDNEWGYCSTLLQHVLKARAMF